MSYEIYRNTTIGITLLDTLEEMIKNEQLTNRIIRRVLREFDKHICEKVSKCDVNVDIYKSITDDDNYKCLSTYRFCDNVWTLILRNVTVTIKDPGYVDHHVKKIFIEKLKIVACEAKDEKRESKARKKQSMDLGD
ncbi:hypothetical protein B4U80_04625 [Leptotrombidium deliense]|uniref:Transcription initiation factor IIA subunit 2 n=1 Tax=Leptotrombidium deliense TaxID=299467 RepID=A0A443S4X1_9ACAR|nr:hypothetical protein B4U80_04625 [Leptotrombidium deliense]